MGREIRPFLQCRGKVWFENRLLPPQSDGGIKSRPGMRVHACPAPSRKTRWYPAITVLSPEEGFFTINKDLLLLRKLKSQRLGKS